MSKKRQQQTIPDTNHFCAPAPSLSEEGKSVCVCVLARDKTSFRKMRTLTDTCGHGAVPLSQGVGHGLAPDGSGAVQRVAWIAFKQHRHANAKVVADALSKPGLRDWAALNGARPRDGCGQGVMRTRGTGGQEDEETKRRGRVAGCVRWGNGGLKERRQDKADSEKKMVKLGLISPHVIRHSAMRHSGANILSLHLSSGRTRPTAFRQSLSNVLSAWQKPIYFYKMRQMPSLEQISFKKSGHTMENK